jgi:glucose-1-phosphate adenylyltransferase
LLSYGFIYLQNALIIGADYYESEEQRAKVLADGGVPLGIGAGSTIKNCIVDKNARIGKNVVIENKGGVEVRFPEIVWAACNLSHS